MQREHELSLQDCSTSWLGYISALFIIIPDNLPKRTGLYNSLCTWYGSLNEPLWTCVREASGSNPSWDTSRPDWTSSWLCSLHPCKCEDRMSVRRRPSASQSGLLIRLCGAGNFENVWSACGQNEIQYTEWRMNKYAYNYVYNFTVRLSIRHVR
jgi:hypothetical protein